MPTPSLRLYSKSLQPFEPWQHHPQRGAWSISLCSGQSLELPWLTSAFTSRLRTPFLLLSLFSFVGYFLQDSSQVDIQICPELTSPSALCGLSFPGCPWKPYFVHVLDPCGIGTIICLMFCLWEQGLWGVSAFPKEQSLFWSMRCWPGTRRTLWSCVWGTCVCTSPSCGDLTLEGEFPEAWQGCILVCLSLLL